MKQEIKEEWVAALTSDEYAQGTAQLRPFDDKYCCLGVLCDVAVKNGIAKWHYDGFDWWILPAGSDVSNIIHIDDKATGLLPVFVQKWAGIEGTNPVAGDYGHLSSLNDTGHTFGHIANLINEVM